MSLFTSILHGVQKKIDEHTTSTQTIIDSIKDVTHVNLPQEAIVSCKEGILSIHTNPTIKSAILLKQKLIIESLKTRGVIVVVIR